MRDAAGQTRREQAARQRAAPQREARIEAALARLAERAQIKRRQGNKPQEARASTTHAEATVMKMGDGGFRPAYNVQYGTDTREPGHRRGGGGELGQRSRTDGADGRTGQRALRAERRANGWSMAVTRRTSR